MEKNNFKRNFLICFFSILVVTGNSIFSNLKAEDEPITQEQQIENAKKVWEIENLYKKGNKKSILELSRFLDDQNKNIRKIASLKLVLLESEKATEYLKKAKKQDIKGKAEIADILIKSKNKSEDKICEEILYLEENKIKKYKNKVKKLDSTKNKEEREKIFADLRENIRPEISVADIIYICCEKGWEEYLFMNKNKYPNVTMDIENHPEVIYKRMKRQMDSLSVKERKKELINLLTNWKLVAEYEAAIRLLAEMGNQVVPDVLELLDDQANIPKKIPPPFERVHTNYSILLTVLKTIPDSISIKKLSELANSDNKFVSEKARKTLIWIKSEVPYPFKYERILLRSQDEH